MLRKLLNYDFKAVFKYWWIAAVSSVALAFVGGTCWSILVSGRVLPTVVDVVSVLGIILTVLGFAAFSILSAVLVYVRFYKNFFTDEGYLTFTLPVKRAQLLNSKLIMSTLTMIATCVILLADVFTMICIAYAQEIFSPDFWEEIAKIWNDMSTALGVYLPVYIGELVLLCLVVPIFSNLFMFVCITFGSLITKKAKVLASIAIYYGASSVLTFVGQIFFVLAMPSLFDRLSNIPEDATKLALALLLGGGAVFVGIFTSLLYNLQYWMLDRKLNLS